MKKRHKKKSRPWRPVDSTTHLQKNKTKHEHKLVAQEYKILFLFSGFNPSLQTFYFGVYFLPPGWSLNHKAAEGPRHVSKNKSLIGKATRSLKKKKNLSFLTPFQLLPPFRQTKDAGKTWWGPCVPMSWVRNNESGWTIYSSNQIMDKKWRGQEKKLLLVSFQGYWTTKCE